MGVVQIYGKLQSTTLIQIGSLEAAVTELLAGKLLNRKSMSDFMYKVIHVMHTGVSF